MVYDMLKRLVSEGRLSECSITVIHRHSANGRKTIHGRDIVDVSRAWIEYMGGEAGRERLKAPLDAVLGIEFNCKPIFRRKKRIERVYPRA
jgi:uncharacterized protein (UPF0248 family)